MDSTITCSIPELFIVFTICFFPSFLSVPILDCFEGPKRHSQNHARKAETDYRTEMKLYRKMFAEQSNS